MPTYEYECQCGYNFSDFHSMPGKPWLLCPKCGKVAKKIISATGGGIIFKGSGFYETDYRRKNSDSQGSDW